LAWESARPRSGHAAALWRGKWPPNAGLAFDFGWVWNTLGVV